MGKITEQKSKDSKEVNAGIRQENYRVNNAVKSLELDVQLEKQTILFGIQRDESIYSIMDYFKIFFLHLLSYKCLRGVLGMKFKMLVNENEIC